MQITFHAWIIYIRLVPKFYFLSLTISVRITQPIEQTICDSVGLFALLLWLLCGKSMQDSYITLICKLLLGQLNWVLPVEVAWLQFKSKCKWEIHIYSRHCQWIATSGWTNVYESSKTMNLTELSTIGKPALQRYWRPVSYSLNVVVKTCGVGFPLSQVNDRFNIVIIIQNIW